MIAARFDWSLLPAGDVLAKLRQSTRPGSAASGFLDTHQWSALADVAGVALSGGHPNAQYRCAALGAATPPAECGVLARKELPAGVKTVAALRKLLANEGGSADCVGDIVFTSDAVWLMLGDENRPGLLGAVEPLSQTAPWPVPAVQRITAASARIDAVSAALFHVSRGEAQTAIKYDFLFQDFRPPLKSSQPVRPGSQIVYRTKGRAEIVALQQNERSGRLWVEYRFFPC